MSRWWFNPDPSLRLVPAYEWWCCCCCCWPSANSPSGWLSLKSAGRLLRPSRVVRADPDPPPPAGPPNPPPALAYLESYEPSGVTLSGPLRMLSSVLRSSDG